MVKFSWVDMIAIYDAIGTKLVSYIYDAWGNLLRTYHNNGGNTGAAKNPFTYRGYYYDYDLELYYLQTRYYDPVVGRFINADALMSGTTGNLHGNNLYAYCFNNPINMIDSSGSWPTWNDIKSTFVAVVEWVNTKIIQPVVAFVNDVVEDVENYDLNNESEDKVLESNYFSSYKGVFVIRTDLDRSGSFGAIFLTREANDRKNPEDVVRHEYGHTKQLEQLGILHYTMCILIPSWQKWGTGEYYSKPWEVTADVYGGVQSRTHSQSTIDDSFAYLKRSKRLGVIVWLFIE